MYSDHRLVCGSLMQHGKDAALKQLVLQTVHNRTLPASAIQLEDYEHYYLEDYEHPQVEDYEHADSSS